MRFSSLSLFGWAFTALIVSCSSSDDTGGGGSGGGTASCVPASADCYATTKDGPGAECLAKSDNTGQSKWQGRLTQIDVQAPPVLAGKFIQENIIDNGISLSQVACNEYGQGSFIWLYEVDSTANTIHTGGGLPIVADPKAGGCYANISVGSIQVKPIDAPVTIDADKLGFHATGIDLNVPIFTTPTDTTNPIILPLHQVKLDAKFNDASHDCVGHFNGQELEVGNLCKPDTAQTPPQRAWTTGGTLAGYITIDEADQVFISELKESLCVLLAPAEFKGPDGYCKSSPKWVAGTKPDGDWCSTTNAAADATCKDAWQLKGNFAASAFKVNGNCP